MYPFSMSCRKLPKCRANGDVILYCIDANSGMSDGAALWGNLAQMFIAAEDRWVGSCINLHQGKCLGYCVRCVSVYLSMSYQRW